MYSITLQNKNAHMVTFDEDEINVKHKNLKDIWHEGNDILDESLTFAQLISPCLIGFKKLSYS